MKKIMFILGFLISFNLFAEWIYIPGSKILNGVGDDYTVYCSIDENYTIFFFEAESLKYVDDYRSVFLIINGIPTFGYVIEGRVMFFDNAGNITELLKNKNWILLSIIDNETNEYYWNKEISASGFTKSVNEFINYNYN